MKIKSENIMFATAVFMQGTNLFLNIILQEGGRSCIIAFALAVIMGAIFLYFVYGKNKRGENRSGFLKKTLEIPIILFFVVYGAFILNLLASFIGGYVLEETPKKLFILLVVFVCTYGAVKGYDNLLRLSVLFFALTLFSDIANLFLLKDKMEFKNMLPVFEVNSMKFMSVFLYSLILLLGDVAVFLYIPYGEKKHTLTGYLVGGAWLGVIIIRTVATLGNMIWVYTWPTHEALRVISSGNTLTRIETSSVFVMLGIMLFKISMLFGVATEKIRKKSGAKSRILPAVFVGGAAYFIAVNISSSGAQAMDIWRNAGVYITAVILVMMSFSIKNRVHIKRQ